MCVQLVGHLGWVLDAVAWVSIDNRCYRYSLFLPRSFVRYHLLSTFPLLRFDLVASDYTSHSPCTESSWRCTTGLADRGYISARRRPRTLLYQFGRPQIHLRPSLVTDAALQVGTAADTSPHVAGRERLLAFAFDALVGASRSRALGFVTVMVVSCPAVAAGPRL